MFEAGEERSVASLSVADTSLERHQPSALSKVRAERAEQSWNAPLPIELTEAGIVTSLSEEHPEKT